MSRRTKESIFYPCLICGKRPYVSYYLPNSGWAVCKGSVFHPHYKIEAFVPFENPSKLIETLANNWNYIQLIKFMKRKIK